MRMSRRWLDWDLPEPARKGAECELTKPTKSFLSVLSVRAENISEVMDASEAPPAPDPEEWLEPVRKLFVQWMDSTCALYPRAFGGVTALLINFCEWLAVLDEAPCCRETFLRLLEELGLLVCEVAGVALISGLVLKEDFKVYA